LTIYWLLINSFLLGFRHAFAVDHIASVSTFIEKNRANVARAIGYSIKIGLGHAAGMCLIAIVSLLSVHHEVTDTWTDWISKISGIWLMVISVWMLVGLIQRKPILKLYLGKWIEKSWAPWLVGFLFGLAVSPGDLAIFTLVLGQSVRLDIGLSLLLVFLCAMLLGLASLGLVFGSIRTQKQIPVQNWLTSVTSVFGLCVGILLAGGWLS
jgi:high-affinity nickel permease